MNVENTHHYLLPFDLLVGLKHCRAFDKIPKKSSTTLGQASQSNGANAPVNSVVVDPKVMVNYEELLSQLHSYGFGVTKHEESCYAYNEVILYFDLPLPPLDTHLLGETRRDDFARRLGFLTQEKVEKRYPGQ